MNALSKSLPLIIFCLVSAAVFGQQVDKVIDMGIYKSYYSYSIKNPLYVTYLLKKGGGPCDRQAEHFNFKKCGENTAGDKDYSNSHFEKGHLANAEDFAGSCSMEIKTFCYYNCVPQTRILNHGQWLQWETKLRQLSQTKPIFIVTGGIYTNRHIKPNSDVLVPDYCYKVVVDPANNNVLYCMLFNNDDSDRMQNLTLSELKAMLNYPLVPQQNLQLK
jgi:endonuclease G